MIYNFADDNTIYDCGKDLSNDLENLKHDMKILLKWFKTNSLQTTLGKEKKAKFGQIDNKFNRKWKREKK